MAKLYSSERLFAFLILLIAYGFVFGLLWGASSASIVEFGPIRGAEDILLSMPFIALYVVVLIGFTAGYAQAAFAAKSLGLVRAVRQQLRTRSMANASIKSKIRGDSVVTMGTPFLRTLEKVITARLPILPVVDNEKIDKVITIRDIMQELTHQINTVKELSKTEELFSRLATLKVEDLKPQQLISCKEDDTLDSVLEKMMRHQFTRLVVVDKDEKTCMGTVDVFDIVSELLSEQAEST